MRPSLLLLLLLAAGAPASELGCVCGHLDRVPRGADGESGLSDDQFKMWRSYCRVRRSFWLFETCETLSPPSVAVPAVRRLVPTGVWEPPPGVGAGACGAALEAALRFTGRGDWAAFWNFSALVAAEWAGSCTAHGSDCAEWNATALSEGSLRRAVLSRLSSAANCVSRAVDSRARLASLYQQRFYDHYNYWNTTEPQAEAPDCIGQFSSYWRDSAQLLSLGVSHVSRLVVPLAFELMANHTSDQRLNKWIKDMEHVRDMLHVNFRGWLLDVQLASEYIANYKIVEDKNNTGKYILRRPVLSDQLLDHQQRFLSLRGDFTALCRQHQPLASQMFGLADALFSFYNRIWFEKSPTFKQYISSHIQLVDEEWQLDDRSKATLSVDTDCLQVLADAMDHPRCPLEDLPPAASRRRQQCREKLWEDMVLRLPHIPVTSYLAYTQRASVNLCLLAWMVANSFSICQDVPFSVLLSVHDARCYFERPNNASCLQSTSTDAICSVSRAILLLKCRDFSFQKHFDECYIKLLTNGKHTKPRKIELGDRYRGNKQPTERTLSFKDSLNDYTLKYRNFKIDSLKPLEISFVAVNILFRFVTAGIYMYLPQLRNLPGKILLSYQMTGMVQILCSEVLYRMVGVPDLSVTVQIDSSLTFLSCIWLNFFCYQMYGYVRHLRLPNDLLPAEATQMFRRQVLCALIPWSVICMTCIALEETSKYYLFYSRVIFLLSILLSVSFNMLCLSLVAYMYIRTRKSMRQLDIHNNDKLGSKKQIVFLSVKSIILSGVGVIIRVGFHQAQGIAQFVYYVHVSTMVQGPILFVFFVCNETALPALRKRALAYWYPDIISPGQELCSVAERILAKRRNGQSLAAESTV